MHVMGEQVAGDVEPALAPFRHAGAADVTVLRPVRRAFSAWLESAACAEHIMQDAVLAFSELFTNALEAGASTVEFVAVLGPGSMTLRLCDDGPRWAPPPQPPTMPDALATRGRGLALLARLGVLDVVRDHDYTEVSLQLVAG